MDRFFRYLKIILFKYKNKKYFSKYFPNIQFDEHWYKRCLSKLDIVSCKLEQIKLKDLKCNVLEEDGWHAIPICQSPDFHYIKFNDKKTYVKYQDYAGKKLKEYVHTRENFDKLIKSLDEFGYDETKPICINKNYEIIDGQHRASYLLNKYGEDIEITVFKVVYNDSF